MASKSKLILLAFVFGALCSGIAAQSLSESRVIGPTRSPVNLLRGYRIQILPGIDSGAGRVWKEGGLNIEIEMCCGFGNAADSVPKSKLQWREEQTTNGHRVILVLTKANELIVSYPGFVTNFKVKIKNSRDLTQALLMILSYDQVAGYPVDPDAIVLPTKPKN